MHFSVLDAVGYQLVEKGDRIVCEVGLGKKGRQVYRIIEVKFTPGRSKDFTALGPLSLVSYPETLEEFEGEIKWYNPIKKFGVVTSYQGGEDIFLHESVLREAGYAVLEPGTHVLIKVSSSERGREARMIKIIR